jgi:RNA polymerase sigma factor (TIGR02999 family)
MTDSPQTSIAPTLEITRLLQRCNAGDEEARQQLFPQVYDDLRRLAQYYLRGRDHSYLQPAELVHEVYLRLFHSAQIEWQDCDHFFHVAGQKMRWLVLDHARRTLAQKRGDGYLKITLEKAGAAGASFARSHETLALNQALSKLGKLHPRTAQVVQLRYFAGLSEEQTARALRVCDRTVRREWAFAKSWLLEQLGAL